MNPRRIDQIITERFRGWGSFLRRQRATPILVLALRDADAKLVVTTVDDLPDHEVLAALRCAAALVEHGKVDNA